MQGTPRWATWSAVVGAVVIGCFLRYAVVTIRAARVPPVAAEEGPEAEIARLITWEEKNPRAALERQWSEWATNQDQVRASLAVVRETYRWAALLDDLKLLAAAYAGERDVCDKLIALGYAPGRTDPEGWKTRRAEAERNRRRCAEVRAAVLARLAVDPPDPAETPEQREFFRWCVAAVGVGEAVH